ncbi:hypothetical protein [Polaromonas sp.]|uniref:hypothetical protein n=1 Tax=Polaromonas sp. TaxID=1869339 RepID=UPI002FCA88C0
MSAAPSPRPSPPAHHLLIPFAACASEAWPQAMQDLPPDHLRHLGKLLQGMKPAHTDHGDVHSLSTPHERVLAQAFGLPIADGLIPWAAWQHLQAGGEPAGKAWAHITPCCWAMGREHATLTDPAALGLQEAESRTLLAAMQPYFESGNITLHYVEPTRWLAQGEVFRTLPSASLDRVLGRNVDAWLPGAGNVKAEKFSAEATVRSEGPPQASTAPSSSERGSVTPEAHAVASVGARSMRLLQNEMQMLLYTHPINDARAAKGLLTVNSFWISGTGALPASFHREALPDVQVPRGLAQAAFNDDWAAYAQAWAALDAGEVADLLQRQRSGEAVRLTLCGERGAQTFETAHSGLFSKISSLFKPEPLWNVLKQL